MNDLEKVRSRVYGAYITTRPDAATGDAEINVRRPYLAKLIERHFPGDRDAAIIDLGCGSGVLIGVAEDAGYRNISGVDRSPEQIALAAAYGRKTVREGDLLDSLRELPAQSQDVVICFDVVEHFTKAEIIDFADEVARVLKIGGRWIIHVPNAEGLFGARIRYADLTHEQAYTPSSISQLLHTVGFAKAQCYEDEPIRHGAKSIVRWILWRLIRNVLQLCLVAETGSTAKGVFSQNLLAVGIR